MPGQIVVVRTEPGPTSVPDPVPVAVPVVAQCLNVTPPGSTTVGGAVLFSATLCTEDGTTVTVRYRRHGGTSWESQRMPLIAGVHRQRVTVDDRFAMGMEYYIVAGEQTFGSAGSPQMIGVQ